MTVRAGRLVSIYLDVDGERHDENGDHDVGDRQRHDEVVGHRLQRLLAVDAHHHQHVAEHRQRRKHYQNQRPPVTSGSAERRRGIAPGNVARDTRRRDVIGETPVAAVGRFPASGAAEIAVVVVVGVVGDSVVGRDVIASRVVVTVTGGDVMRDFPGEHGVSSDTQPTSTVAEESVDHGSVYAVRFGTCKS